MHCINNKRAYTVLTLSLLITSLLLVNSINIPSAQPTQTMHLHGPPLKPIHMHSNITLTPIHMHHTKGIIWPTNLTYYEPNCTTDWYAIYPPQYDPPWERWHLTSFEDVGEPIPGLSQNDQIDMTNEGGETLWFHVDRMTLTLNLSGPYPTPWHEPAQSTRLLELKQNYCQPYDPYIVFDPLDTVWHEVWPVYSGIFTITDWFDDPANINGMLDFTDSISFDFGMNWWHVEDIATDLILRWKMLDPIGTYWHELYPDFCEWYEITSWSSFPDPWCDRISPKDTIDMYRFSDQTTHWYMVDRVTLTINVTDVDTHEWMMLELKTLYYEEMYHALKKPINTFWHAVYPEDVYCTIFNLTWWDPMDPLWDNCNGVLDPCDHIVLKNLTDGLDQRYHITDIAYDIILNEYITDPVCNDWTELYPIFGEEWHISDFVDTNADIWLSPCDNITLQDPAGAPYDVHVENVTLTLNVTILDITGTGGLSFTPGDRIYLENLENLKNPWNYTWPRLYHPKIEPWNTTWMVVYPTDYFDEQYEFGIWIDNCNGVIDTCDTITLTYVDQSQTLIVHVDEIAVDIVVEPFEEPPPPPTWYKKPSYRDYAQSGMPDFDQKQDGWGIPPLAPTQWTWCGPVAVANSFWWFDSKYEDINGTGPIPPPTISDNFRLVTAYGPWDDHDPRNVLPFVNNLAHLMDTDGQRTGLIHTGTNYIDMETGISQYLQQQGINPVGDADGDGDVDNADFTIINNAMGTTPMSIGWDMRADIIPVGGGNNLVDINDLNAAIANNGSVGMFWERTVDFPDFYWIEEEIELCEDVVLLLEFWNETAPGVWDRIENPYDFPGGSGGHYVTAAGVNSTTRSLLLADPWQDAAEAGWPGEVPVAHAYPHATNVHNDTQFVSHDAYLAAQWIEPPPSPYPGTGIWELVGYLQQLGFPPWMRTFIRAAIVTSPLPTGVHDINVTGISRFRTIVPDDPTVVFPPGTNSYRLVNVTVLNEGNFNETFDLTVFVNASSIGNQTIALATGASTTVMFRWDTRNWTKSNYTVSAYAYPVPGELDTSDNTLVDGIDLLTILGDVNGDTIVDITDITMTIAAFGSTSNSPNWYAPNWWANRDVDDNDLVDITDIVIVIGKFGTTW